MASIKEALAEYEAAQAQQAATVQRMNRHAELHARVHDDVVAGEGLPFLLAYRAQSLRLDAAFSASGARVFQAAADLVRALYAEGFGPDSGPETHDRDGNEAADEAARLSEVQADDGAQVQAAGS